MRTSGRDHALIALACLGGALAATAPPAAGAGFQVFEQAAKAAALGGAFAAQADDPSAMFYNVGALGLLGAKPKLTAGAGAWSRNQALYQGLSPGVGAGTNGEQDSAIFPLLHAYLAQPLGERIKIGLGLHQPFLLDAEWARPDEFAGRHLALAAEITALDLNPSIGFQLTPRLGIGAGAIYRTSELAWLRREQRLNPFSGEIADVAEVAVSTAMNDGFGWNAGLVHRPGERFSWGLAYRSEVEIDYTGEGRLTQIASGNDQLDELLRATLPFDQDLGVTSTVTFPDQVTVAVAFKPLARVTVEVDLVRTGWSSFERFAVDFPSDPELSASLEQRFVDSDALRIGLRLRSKAGAELRFGLVSDESPQPDETVGPLLADADALSLAVGAGKEPLDVAFVWTDLDRRSVTTNVDGVNGNYSGNRWLFLLSISN